MIEDMNEVLIHTLLEEENKRNKTGKIIRKLFKVF